MIIKDVFWTSQVNVLLIICDCGYEFQYPCSYSVVECPKCKNKEIWHEDALKFNEIYGTNYKLIKRKRNI